VSDVAGLSRLGRAYQRAAARLLDTYPNARAQGHLHSIDDMIVKDLAHTYPTATGREVQRAMVESSPHLHEKAGHVDDDTRRRVRKVWESVAANPSHGCARSGTAAAASARARGGAALATLAGPSPCPVRRGLVGKGARKGHLASQLLYGHVQFGGGADRKGSQDTSPAAYSTLRRGERSDAPTYSTSNDCGTPT